LRTGAAVVPTFSVPQPDGSYRTVYLPELTVRREEDLDREAYRITREATALIEEWVRRYPEHWLWMHRRWKTPAPPSGSPEEQASGYHSADTESEP